MTSAFTWAMVGTNILAYKAMFTDHVLRVMRVEAHGADPVMDGESHLGRALIRWEPPTGRFAATTFADDFHLGSSGAIGIRGHPT